jgi:hypothetical protein
MKTYPVLAAIAVGTLLVLSPTVAASNAVTGSSTSAGCLENFESAAGAAAGQFLWDLDVGDFASNLLSAAGALAACFD